MTEVHPTPSHAGKVGSFLQQSTAGLPNWAWLLVIAGGIAAAYIVPKFFGGATTTTGNNPTGGNTGLGLAIDPATGLPYAVEGLTNTTGNTNTGGGNIDTSGNTNTGNTNTANNTSDTDSDNTNIANTNNTGNIQNRNTGSVTFPKTATTRKQAGLTSIIVRSGPYNTAPTLTPLAPGATVTLTGPPVIDASNIAWYPIKGGGYVYGYDLVLPASGSTGPRPGQWPTNYIRSRHFRIAS